MNKKHLSCHHPVFIGCGNLSGEKHTPLDCPEKCTACQTSLKVNLLEGFLQKRALSDGFGGWAQKMLYQICTLLESFRVHNQVNAPIPSLSGWIGFGYLNTQPQRVFGALAKYSQDLFNINCSNTLYFDPCYYVNHCLIYIYHRKIPNHPHVCFIKISNPWKSLVGGCWCFVAPENPTCTAGFRVIGDFGDFGGSAPGDFRVIRMDPPWNPKHGA